MKYLLIIFLFFFLVFRLGGFLIKMLAGGSNSKDQRKTQQNRGRKYTPPGGNVHVDYEPDKEKRDPKGYRGGEYVDYEDV